MASRPDFSTPFNDFMGLVTGLTGGALKTIAAVGGSVVVIAVGKYFWDKWRGRGGDTKKLWWAVAIGGLAMVPGFLGGFLMDVAEVVVYLAVLGGEKVLSWFGR